MSRTTLSRAQAFKVAAFMTQWKATIADKRLTLTKVWEDLTKQVEFPLTRANVKRIAQDLDIELSQPNSNPGRYTRASELSARIQELERRMAALETSLGVKAS